jgi:F420-0:gamma-glutamyl ligase
MRRLNLSRQSVIGWYLGLAVIAVSGWAGFLAVEKGLAVTFGAALAGFVLGLVVLLAAAAGIVLGAMDEATEK